MVWVSVLTVIFVISFCLILPPYCAVSTISSSLSNAIIKTSPFCMVSANTRSPLSYTSVFSVHTTVFCFCCCISYTKSSPSSNTAYTNMGFCSCDVSILSFPTPSNNNLPKPKQTINNTIQPNVTKPIVFLFQND